MTTALLGHDAFLEHETPFGHPENSQRLRAVSQALAAAEFEPLLRMEARECEDKHILLAHTRAFLDAITQASPQTGVRSLDADTHMSPGSLTAARHAVGANIQAVDEVMNGSATNAFCAVRPPGHHAEKTRPMGFCLFGNVAIGAKHALDVHGLERVAIIDFDVHHGNGTQDLVWDDERIMFASTHEMPLFPGSGARNETGAHGQIMNVPLAAGTSGPGLRAAYRDEILPAVRNFAPQFVFISAGFDGHTRDPLANLALVEDDFAWVTREICALANDCADAKLVSTLEGGYDLPALGRSVAAHVKVLMEQG